MKKTISILSFLLLIGIISVSAQCCGSSEDSVTVGEEATEDAQTTEKVEVYYFHATRRCATCQAVEAVSAEAIKEYYGDKVPFIVINRDEDKDNPLIKEHKISGQTLLVIYGKEVVNLTNNAFLNARNNPEKLKSKIKSTIDSMK